jgi:hypothetical protein
MKPTLWKRKHTPTQTAPDQISSFAMDVRAMHYAVNDTVVETRGQFKDERPGDVLRLLRGRGSFDEATSSFQRSADEPRRIPRSAL